MTMLPPASRDSAADQIWGLVCGFAEPVRSHRRLLMLKAYIDDSNMTQGPVAVLAGWVGTADMWAALSEDWDKALRMSPRIDHFKWAEAANFNGPFNGMSEQARDEKIRLLVSVIADHEPLGLGCAMPLNLHKTIFGENKDRHLRAPYFFCFYSLVTQLVGALGGNGMSDRVDFIFDAQPGEMESAVGSWEHLKKVSPPHVNRLIGNVSFHDDKLVLPLQAADLTAGWTRVLCEDVYRGLPQRTPPWGTSIGGNLRMLARYWTPQSLDELRIVSELGKGSSGE